jgi:hypothetical protein
MADEKTVSFSRMDEKQYISHEEMLFLIENRQRTISSAFNDENQDISNF